MLFEIDIWEFIKIGRVINVFYFYSNGSRFVFVYIKIVRMLEMDF